MLSEDWLARQANFPAKYGTSLVGHDPFGRVGTVLRGNAVQRSFVYHGPSEEETYYVRTTPTSETSQVRKRVRDGLGRLIRVEEPATNGGGTRVTSYAYDALDRLVTVDMQDPVGQHQIRTFSYDGLGNIRLATEPESGTTT